jgi:hypothetical protein
MAIMVVIAAIMAAGAVIDKDLLQVKLNTGQSLDCLFY